MLLWLRVAEEILLGLTNAGFQPQDKCSYERLRLLERTFHSASAKLLALPHLGPAQVTKQLAGTLSGGACLTLYCGGNLDADDALRIYGAHQPRRPRVSRSPARPPAPSSSGASTVALHSADHAHSAAAPPSGPPPPSARAPSRPRARVPRRAAAAARRARALGQAQARVHPAAR